MKIVRFPLLIAPFILILCLIQCIHDRKYLSKRNLISMEVIKCNKLWDELQTKVIKEEAIKKVFAICNKDNIAWNDKSNISNKYYLLKHSLETFNCSRDVEFLNVPRPYVALASVPGSGNTWTRLLIETITGIKTGSVYRDTVFDGSKFCPARGKVFIVKTHNTHNGIDSHRDCIKMGIKTLNVSRAIYILRNPYDVFLAEFNRRNADRRTSVMNTVPIESFNTIKWKKFVRTFTNRWKYMSLNWLQRKDIPVFVLIYERLVENVVLEIYNLAKFLSYKILFKHVYCLSSKMTNKYKRHKPRWLTKENIYNDDLREVVNSAIQYVKHYVDTNLKISNVLESYILPTNTLPQ